MVLWPELGRTDQQFQKHAVNFKKRIIFLKSAVPTAARGTGAPKRTVLKKAHVTTLDPLNRAGFCS